MNLERFFEIASPFLEGKADLQKTAEALFGPEANSSRDARRLSTYRDLDLGVALKAVFPRVYSVVTERSGKSGWDALAGRYFEIYPARHFELNMNGMHLPDYLQEYAAQANLPSWLAELADFEWWEWKTLTAPDDPADAEPNEGLLRLGATVELRPYEHDLIAWCADDGPKKSPTPRTAVTVFWRDVDSNAWRRNIDDLDLRLLSLIHQNQAITPLTMTGISEWSVVEERLAEMIKEGILLGRPPARYLSESGTVSLTAPEMEIAMRSTMERYGLTAQDYFEASLEHDVSQNYDAFLSSIDANPPYDILDLGCGSGRDLRYFRLQGHNAVGLDGVPQLLDIASAYSGCAVQHQDFLNLTLPDSSFDGIFANASLFHVPSQELPRVLRQLWSALKPGGILFSSNPIGNNQEGWVQDRYAVFYDLETWSRYLQSAGFERLFYYYRPQGQPREKQEWLATVWRRQAQPNINGQAP